MARIRRRKAMLFFSRMIKYKEVFYHSSLSLDIQLFLPDQPQAAGPDPSAEKPDPAILRHNRRGSNYSFSFQKSNFDEGISQAKYRSPSSKLDLLIGFGVSISMAWCIILAGR
jgi:hypothetical protein